MRNWNCSWAMDQAEIITVLSLPMRNWNATNANPVQKVFVVLVLSLPMRNWNPVNASHRWHMNSVLSLPMRNWNMCKFDCIWLGEVMFWAYLWGIETQLNRQPTPEMLSLPMRNWNLPEKYKKTPRLLSGFEPTYEELKLVSLLSALDFGFSFWAYLWGIETFLIGR